jgi:hypothetical protein
MGSSLSPIVSNIFMNHIERTFFDEAIQKGDIRFAFRYVDDLIICSRTDKVDEIFEKANNLHPNIKFTIEKMKNNRLPFLDTEVRFENNKLELFHYQKPSKSNCTAHFTDSIAPRSQKMSLLTGELNRIYNATSCSEALDEGIKRATQKFIQNGFPPNLVKEKIRYLKSLNFEKEQFENETDVHHYFKASFTGARCDTIGNKIKKIIKSVTPKFRLTLAWKTIRLESVIYPRLKREIPLRRRSGLIYEYKCFCGIRYQGETSRTIEVRFKEHFDKNAELLPIGTHSKNCEIFQENYKKYLSEPNTLSKFKRKNTAEKTKLTEFALHSDLISIVESSLENYHERKMGEGITIKLSDPVLNRQVNSKHVNFM